MHMSFNLLEPKSIAVIGASNTTGKVGHDIVHNLRTQGYKGEIFPVNTKEEIIQGLPAFTSVGAILNPVELAIIVIPAKYVPAVVKECKEKQVKAIMIISAGFSEVHTEEGLALEAEILHILQGTNIQLIGPNCLGLIRPSTNMNASFGKEVPPSGSIAFVSQSGAMAVALMDGANQHQLGFSTVASIGNKAGMDETDWLELCAADPNTSVIGFYLESIKDGPRFTATAKRISQNKPIILLKSGVSEHGKKAASSHTGALAGNDAAINAACTEAGIHRAHSADELLLLMRALSSQPTLLSNNVAIVTNAGGPGILATDAAEAYQLNLPTLEEKTLAALTKHLPSTAGLVNPIDVIGDADAERYQHAIEACLLDDQIDGLCVILTPQVMTPVTEVAKVIINCAKKFPLIPVTTAFMGSNSTNKAVQLLQQAGIPNGATPEQAMQALASLQPKKVDNHPKKVTTKSGIVTDQVPAGLLSEEVTKQLLAHYNVPMPKQGVVQSAAAAIQLAEALGYPVIAKISSPDIVHKTDVGGVRVNLKTSEAVQNAYEEILQNIKKNAPNADIKGIFMQKFLPVGHEFIIGAMRDPTFGPLIMVGLGGIYTELFKDTSFRLGPVSEKQSYEMLQELAAWKLLLGMRGQAQSDIEELAETIARVSVLISSEPRIKEIDINPILVGTNEVVVADVKIIIE